MELVSDGPHNIYNYIIAAFSYISTSYLNNINNNDGNNSKRIISVLIKMCENQNTKNFNFFLQMYFTNLQESYGLTICKT